MVEILVISESRTAIEMIKTVRRVLGTRAVRNVHPFVIKSNYSSRKVCEFIRAKISSFGDRIDGVLLMTEMFGSTQSNLCLGMLEGDNVRLICGYNLPMLLKAATLNQTSSLRQLTPKLTSEGKKYIRVFSKLG